MSDVSITVTGLPGIRPLSCEFQLGINQLPVAYVSIDPTKGNLLSNMDGYRRTQCQIEVVCDGKTISFPCLFDGLSTSMSPGGITYTAVFKSLFQTWLEVFPFMPGVSPMGINPFLQQSYTSVAGSSGETASLNDTIANALGGSYREGSPLIVTLVKCIAEIINICIRGMAKATAASTVNDLMIQNILNDIASGKNSPSYAKALAAAASLSASIDTSAVSGFVISSAGTSNMQFFFNMFINSSGEKDLWSMLVSAVTQLGGCVVPSLNKIYIVPQCFFLKPTTRSIPGKKQNPDIPNFAAPGFYDNLHVSDSGYKDISSVALVLGKGAQEFGITVSGPSAAQALMGTANSASAYYGSYPKGSSYGAKGGLVVLEAGPLATLYAAYSPNVSFESQGAVMTSSFSKPITVSEGQARYREVSAAALNPNRNNITSVLDNLAQAKFFELKYMDRTGSLNLLFSPNWVPGTTGSAFSRHPEPNGMFVDFYVTGVVHAFAPGSATTRVSFAGARIGDSPEGLDSYDLFKYDAAKMAGMQASYIADF